ncbi:MAG: serine/threonine protein kinase [Actinomycetia bacterium]|nr:serine/threonine protein kinase [Actinomycetes bacterium]
MKVGDVINGYRVVTEPTNTGGAMCMWAFTVKDGREYFIKEFLQPKWPLPESMGSEASKLRRREDCYEFEQRHTQVMSRLADATTVPGGGNLVTALAFFRAGTMYYKVTEKVVTASLESLHDLAEHERAVIFRTLVLSIQMLHRKDIVHGDLKPTNILIQQVPGSALHTAKLIDFDDSYLSGNPPPRDQIVGDSAYGAPEWFGYAMNDDRISAPMLTKAADIFALGLIFHQYLTNSMPAFGPRFSAPGQAVAAGDRLAFDRELSLRLVRLLDRMLSTKPGDRPTIGQVFEELRHEELLTLGASTITGRRLRINTDAPAAPGPGPGAGAGPGTSAPGSSRVRINFNTKKES